MKKSGSAKIDFGCLLGFSVLGDKDSGVVDFKDATLAARLGAKVGLPETTKPATELSLRDDTRDKQ